MLAISFISSPSVRPSNIRTEISRIIFLDLAVYFVRFLFYLNTPFSTAVGREEHAALWKTYKMYEKMGGEASGRRKLKYSEKKYVVVSLFLPEVSHKLI